MRNQNPEVKTEDQSENIVISSEDVTPLIEAIEEVHQEMGSKIIRLAEHLNRVVQMISKP